MIEHTVTSSEAGLLLRELLRRMGLSHRALSALKKREDGILLNGIHATVRAVLSEGDRVTLAVEDTEGGVISPSPIEVRVLYEDGHITACYKPAGMPTHPSHLHYEDTLANALAFRHKDEPYVFRAVGRLDRETDGVVLTARNAFAAGKLGEAMKAGEIRKEYYAVAAGETPPSGEITLPIRRARDSVMLRETAPDGDYARTLFERVAVRDGKSLVRVYPITGRTHQIRVHFAAIGYPLCGDTLYGTDESAGRTLLHAHSLTFPHPLTNEEMTVTAPFPEDIAEFFPEFCK